MAYVTILVWITLFARCPPLLALEPCCTFPLEADYWHYALMSSGIWGKQRPLTPLHGAFRGSDEIEQLMHCTAMDGLDGSGPKLHCIPRPFLLQQIHLFSLLPNRERKLRAGQLCLQSLLLWASPSLLPFPSVPRKCFISIGGPFVHKIRSVLAA